MEKESEVDEDSKGPDLLASEIKAAIKDLKNGKAVCIDGIPENFGRTWMKKQH